MQAPILSLTATVLTLSLARGAFGSDENPAAPGWTAPNPEIIHALADVRRQYGADAVLHEGFLLTHSIQGGSVLETAISVGGIEQNEGRKYLSFTVETGIVYNDHELNADARLGRTWTRIVERSLRMFRSLTVPADGLRFVVTYTHKPYIDEPDLRAHLRDGHGEAESATFYLLTTDVTELVDAKIDGQQLADRAIVLVNGGRQTVRVEPPEPVVVEPTASAR